MVLGSVITSSPAFDRRRAFLAVPPPPRHTSPVEARLAVVGDDGLGHVHELAIDEHLVGLVAAGAEDRAADGKDPGQRSGVEPDPAVLSQAAEAVPVPDDLYPVGADRGLAEAADGGVQTGAVAAGREDANAALGGHAGILRRRR